MEIPKILEKYHCEPPQHVGAFMFLNGRILLLRKEKGDAHWTLPRKDTCVPEPIRMTALGHVSALATSLFDIDRERSPHEFEWLSIEPLNWEGGLFFFIDVEKSPEIQLFEKYADFTWLSKEELEGKKFLLAENTTSVLRKAWLIWAFDKAMKHVVQHMKEVSDAEEDRVLR